MENTNLNMENTTNLIIQDLPVEIFLNILEYSFSIDDILNLYKSCKFFNNVINKYKIPILLILFENQSFSNSYYNLFFSFINHNYIFEMSKQIPYLYLKQLLNWHKTKTNENDCIKHLLIQFLTNDDNLQILVDENSLGLFKNFLHLLYLPSEYIYNSSTLLKKYFCITSLNTLNKNYSIILKIQKQLTYLITQNQRTRDQTQDQTQDQTPSINTNYCLLHQIYKTCKEIYPDIIIKHILGFKSFLNEKKFYKILHNFILNLFIEWLFENECYFIENLYYELFLLFPNFMQKCVYKIIYAEFDIYFDINSDEFVDEFYSIHRIFMPNNKINSLYNRLQLDEYKQLIINSKQDWQFNLPIYFDEF